MALSKLTDTVSKLVAEAEPSVAHADPRLLYNAILMYLFRGLNQKAFGARLRKITGSKPNIKAITECLHTNGYVMKNLKIWIFYVVKHRCDETTARSLARRWQIRLCDFRAFANINGPVMAYMKTLARKYQALTLERMDKELVYIHEELKTWLGKFVSKKHTFIIRSQSLERHDITSELTGHGIQGLFVVYPCVLTRLHALNTVKRVIHNQGINLIYKYTSQKSGRLTTEADGSHQARVIALDEAQLNLVAAPVTVTDLTHDLHRWLQTLPTKKRTFVELLCGSHCDWFTAWLNYSEGYSVDTNEELADRLKSKDYVRLIMEYLDLSIDRVRKMIEVIQSKFAVYAVRKPNVLAI